MNFFDDKTVEFTQHGAQYYFNILVKVIGINPQFAESYMGDMDEIYYIDHITDPHPYIIYSFIDDELEEDIEYDIEYFPHCVVEVNQILGVSWWDMIDFRTNDPWRIELEEE